MKKLSLIAIGLLFLSAFGCALASQTVQDVDRHIIAMVAPDTASTDCIAGFYSGVAFNTDNLKISKAVVELETLADKASADYKRCRAKGLEVSILAIAGKEGADDAIKKIISLGLF